MIHPRRRARSDAPYRRPHCGRARSPLRAEDCGCCARMIHPRRRARSDAPYRRPHCGRARSPLRAEACGCCARMIRPRRRARSDAPYRRPHCGRARSPLRAEACGCCARMIRPRRRARSDAPYRLRIAVGLAVPCEPRTVAVARVRFTPGGAHGVTRPATDTWDCGRARLQPSRKARHNPQGRFDHNLDRTPGRSAGC